MRKRVFLVRNVMPEMYGGGETYQLKLARLLKQSGFEPIIVSSSLNLLDAARRSGITVIKAPFIKRQNWSGWRNILFPIYSIKILNLKRWYKRIFEKYEPDVVNIQSRDDWIAATSLAKSMGIKVLWTDHMDLRSWVLTNVDIWYKNWIGKWVLKSAQKADKIIMISNYERKCFEKLIKPRVLKNTITIKNGAMDEYGIYRDIRCKKENIVYLGRIVDYKGIAELIKAFEIVNGEYPHTVLNVYGGGEDFKKYRELAKYNKCIIFHGQTDEPLKTLAENEVFVLPSYREGLSLSLLDAAMMGKKIIASDVDGNPEVVVNGETGLLVPARNVKKLAEAMIWMLEYKKESEIMAKNARRKYEREFDFEKIFKEKMLPLYNNKKEKE